MKKLLFLVLASAVFSLAIKSAIAEPPTRKVSVVGSATIKVVPDEMRWTVEVNVRDATLAQAKDRHDASLAAALKVVKDLHDAAKDLQTGGIRFDKETLYANTDPEVRANPYSCATEFTFTMVNFDKYGPAADALAKIDGIQIDSIEYAFSKEKETRREALKQALQNAHDKANDLATTAGCFIDKPLEIVEAGAANSPLFSANLITGTSSRTPGAEVGQLEITSSVTATYDLYYK